MGDQIGQAIEGSALSFLPLAELQRIRSINLKKELRTALFADMCRLNTLYMIARAGSGHIGSSFSSLDMISWLLLEEVTAEDVFFSSKGHDAPGYYAALIGTGRMDFDLIHKLRKIDGLPGHPDIGTKGIVTNTGSLGMGISKAKGMVLANRLTHRPGRVFVLTGDGELQEGQFWESLLSAVNFGIHELTVIIDHNKLQSDTFVKNVSDLGNIEAKLLAFGWRVERCDGNDLSAFSSTLARIRDDRRPKIIIADTIKGKGVSFMEHTALDSDVAMYRFHSGAPDIRSYQLAVEEISRRLEQRVNEANIAPLRYETVRPEVSVVPAPAPQRLIPAYTRALLDQAQQLPHLVALDADLILDTGLIPFRETFPDRFFECGIAEQDMVSMAGGMALNGLLPVVHSFACFLSARPNEQIYNNATEKTKIVYVGSLAGTVPGGPGHSHQAVRDIAALAAMPGMTLVEPCCEDEVGPLFHWCLNKALGSSYLRLVSLPWEIPYQLPKEYRLEPGQGVTLVEGSDLVCIAAGPVLLSAAVAAAVMVADTHAISVRVINLPWLNRIDPDWLEKAMGTCQCLVTLDNHYLSGGQGEIIAAAVAGITDKNIKVRRIGLTDIPPSGTNSQVLSKVGLDAEALAAAFTLAFSDQVE